MDSEGAFVTGFLEGEACFQISEQNGGQSFSCLVTVKLRDDDQELLEWLVARTGLGRLSRVPAHGTSRPQILWAIGTQDHCRQLATLIDGSGFCGRRSSDLAVWREAVEAWTTMGGDRRRRTMRALAQRLREARRFRVPTGTARLPTDRSTRLGYISGLVCAEGSFGLSDGRPRFSMHLRAVYRLFPGGWAAVPAAAAHHS